MKSIVASTGAVLMSYCIVLLLLNVGDSDTGTDVCHPSSPSSLYTKSIALTDSSLPNLSVFCPSPSCPRASLDPKVV